MYQISYLISYRKQKLLGYMAVIIDMYIEISFLGVFGSSICWCKLSCCPYTTGKVLLIHQFFLLTKFKLKILLVKLKHLNHAMFTKKSQIVAHIIKKNNKKM